MNRNLCLAAFVAGLIAVCWVGAGYIGSHPLALTMTLIIGAVYLMGALELRRFQQATSTLALALEAIPENLTHLGEWLDQIHPSLQNPVRLRIEGERVGLPGPAVTPYLVGLLVMLGMLGSFLGMVVTLNGAVIALESTTDLQTIRAALAAPVKGLGLAFGTSVAGVAASAMLGLISALCRRERLLAGQRLDTRIATVLRGFSLTHQRQETFKALQSQSQALPEVVDKLQAMMAQMERQSQQLNERLVANQEGFHRDIKDVYTDLAGAVDLSLKASLTESARVAGATIQPVVEATMAGIARETTALHERVASTVNAQLDGISARFDTSVTAVADSWSAALAKHEQSSDRLTQGMGQSLEAFAASFEQRSAALLSSINAAHGVLQTELASHDQQRLAALTQALEAMATALRQEWQAAGAQAAAQQQQICRTLEQSALGIQENAQAQARTTLAEMAGLTQAAAEAPRAAAEVIGQLRQLQAELATRDEQRQMALTQSLEAMAAALQQEWQQAGAQTLAQQQQICQTLEQSALGIHEQAHTHSRNTIDEIAGLMQAAAAAPRAAAEVIGELRQVQADLATQDQQRQAVLAQSLETMAAALRQEWQQAGAQSLAQQQQICQTLEQTAKDITEQAQAHAGNTINEIARLMQTAAEAPRVAAEVIGELRQQLSHSVVRDNELLEERSRVMETLKVLLDTINHASAEQRGAIDALVASSAAMLERVGSQFTEQVAGESAKMIDVAAQMTSSAVEVSSLGEALGFAVQQFSEANEKLIGNLQRIEGSLDKSMLRSDEQLAYYVAQAREIIDLSIMSQKQIVEDLQQLSGNPATLANEVG